MSSSTASPKETDAVGDVIRETFNDRLNTTAGWGVTKFDNFLKVVKFSPPTTD